MMVDVFYVHPDLNITNCAEAGDNWRKYLLNYVRAIKHYEEFVSDYCKEHHVHEDDLKLLKESNVVEDLTEQLSCSTIDDSCDNVYGRILSTSIPTIPDYQAWFDSAYLSKDQKTILRYHESLLQLALMELKYMKSYCQVNKTVKDVFGLVVLTPELEEEGLQKLSKLTEEMKSLEKQLIAAKERKQDLAAKLLTEYGVVMKEEMRRKSTTPPQLNSIEEETVS